MTLDHKIIHVDFQAEAFGEKLRLLRHPQEASNPLVRVVNDHVFIYQDNKDPIILTQTQFLKIAKSLGQQLGGHEHGKLSG